MKIIPLHTNVLIKLNREDNGLFKNTRFLTDMDKTKPVYDEGVIAALGAKCSDEELSVGATVIAKGYSGLNIKMEDGEYKIIEYKDIVAVVSH